LTYKTWLYLEENTSRLRQIKLLIFKN